MITIWAAEVFGQLRKPDRFVGLRFGWGTCRPRPGSGAAASSTTASAAATTNSFVIVKQDDEERNEPTILASGCDVPDVPGVIDVIDVSNVVNTVNVERCYGSHSAAADRKHKTNSPKKGGEESGEEYGDPIAGHLLSVAGVFATVFAVTATAPTFGIHLDIDVLVEGM